MDKVRALRMDASHAGDEQGVHILLQRIDVNDTVLQLLGVAEIREFPEQFADLLRAGDHHVQHLQRSRLNGLHIVHVDPDHNLLDLVRHLVNVMAQIDHILPFNGSDEGFGQPVGQLVLLIIRLMLDLMKRVHFFLHLGRIKISQVVLQLMGGPAGQLRAGNKVIEIKRVLFF